jgi:uncharacterized membrane protein
MQPTGLFLFNISRTLLAISLASQRLFCAPFLAWFQVKRVSFDFLDDVFLLYLAFKAPQSAFKRLSILQMDFCQLKVHHLPGKPPV